MRSVRAYKSDQPHVLDIFPFSYAFLKVSSEFLALFYPRVSETLNHICFAMINDPQLVASECDGYSCCWAVLEL